MIQVIICFTLFFILSIIFSFYEPLLTIVSFFILFLLGFFFSRKWTASAFKTKCHLGGFFGFLAGIIVFMILK